VLANQNNARLERGTRSFLARSFGRRTGRVTRPRLPPSLLCVPQIDQAAISQRLVTTRAGWQECEQRREGQGGSNEGARRSPEVPTMCAFLLGSVRTFIRYDKIVHFSIAIALRECPHRHSQALVFVATSEAHCRFMAPTREHFPPWRPLFDSDCFIFASGRVLLSNSYVLIEPSLLRSSPSPLPFDALAGECCEHHLKNVPAKRGE